MEQLAYYNHNAAVRSIILQVANLQHSPRHSLRSNDIIDYFITINHRWVSIYLPSKM